MNRILLFFIILGFSLTPLLPARPAAAGDDISVYAALDRLSFPVDRGAVLMVTVEGTSRNVEVKLPETPDIQVDSRGQSSKINMINGNVSSSVIYNYLVRVDKPGEYTIGPITVSVSGDDYTTAPVHFTATASELMNESGTGAKDDIAFIRVHTDGNHYLSEIVPVTIKAYFTDRYQAQVNSLPTLTGDGVVMEPLSEKPIQTREHVGGKSYNVLSWDTTLTGVKTGEHNLQIDLDATILLPDRNNRSGFGRDNLFSDPFFRNSPFNDPFFGNMFGNVERRELKLESTPVSFNVMPLPQEGQPADFTGTVGNFDLKVSVQPTTADVGEPLTLTISISGQGNFDGITPPQLSANDNWKTYNPTEPPRNVDTRDTNRTWEQAVVAKTDKVTEIPTLSFSYFNPVSETYVTRLSTPIPITIRPAPEAAQSSAAPSAAVPAAAQQPQTPAGALQAAAGSPGSSGAPGSLTNLAPVKLATGNFHATIRPLFMQKWYIGCWAALILLFFGFSGYWLWLKRANRDSLHKRHAARKKQLELGLAKLQEAIANDDQRTFLLDARSVIQNHVGEHLQRSPATITTETLHSYLNSCLSQESMLPEILAMADAIQYGALPKPLPKQEMQKLFTVIEQELLALC